MGRLWGAAGAALSHAAAFVDEAARNPLYAKLAFAAACLFAGLLVVRGLWPTAAPRERRSGERAFALQSTTLADGDEDPPELTVMGTIANKVFLQFETVAYVALALLLAATVILGITGSAATVVGAALAGANENTLVVTVDRMLFVLMVVEILRTVRDSFRSGRLVSEPFLIVGLIASIRRVLVITLESSQASRVGIWTSAMRDPFNASMLELAVLGALILVMVVSIFLLRMSRRWRKL